MKKLLVILPLLLLTVSMVAALMHEENLTVDNSHTPAGASLRVQTLKYEPYPVNPGDSFDVWIQIENIGMNPAENAKFELLSDYPFTVSNPTREIAHLNGVSGDKDTNQLILKYRVSVAKDAPEGDSELKLRTTTDNIGSAPATTTLDISIGKTKTDFDVVMQGSSEQGTSLAIANIGENPGTAVTIRIPAQDGFKVSGPDASIIGNLDKGDFTTVTFKVNPQGEQKELTVVIEYTDIAGVRNTVEKKVSVDSSATSGNMPVGTGSTQTRAQTNSTPWTYIIVSLAAGALMVYLIMRRRKK